MSNKNILAKIFSVLPKASLSHHEVLQSRHKLWSNTISPLDSTLGTKIKPIPSIRIHAIRRRVIPKIVWRPKLLSSISSRYIPAYATFDRY